MARQAQNEDAQPAKDVIDELVPDEFDVEVQRNARGDGRIKVVSPEDPITVDDDFAKGDYVCTPRVQDLADEVRDGLEDYDLRGPLNSIGFEHRSNAITFSFSSSVELER